mgnify:CR=1 FL=1
MSAASILIALFNAASSIIAADFFFSAFADKLVGKKQKRELFLFLLFLFSFLHRCSFPIPLSTWVF